MKFLLVDDRALFRHGLRELLSRLAGNHVFVKAENCAGALAEVSAHPDIDPILLDLALPDLNGLDGLVRLRELCPTTPVVLLSANGNSHVIVDGLRRGAQGFIPKSSSIDEMTAALTQILAGEIYVPMIGMVGRGGPNHRTRAARLRCGSGSCSHWRQRRGSSWASSGRASRLRVIPACWAASCATSSPMRSVTRRRARCSWAAAKGYQVAIALCDTGPGIAPEFHEAIFREFYQLGNPELDRHKGLGLGLAIVDGLCRILDHPLELKSRVGHGSTFSVRVPSAPGDEPCLDDTEETASFGLRGFAVVVVDDDKAIREALAEVLGGWGCHVMTAESAGDALLRLADGAFSPDAIIADYRLREGRSGTEAIAEIRRALGRDVPAAILTGDTAPERLREASASGLLLLHKPVQPSRLRAVLSRWHAEAVGALHELA